MPSYITASEAGIMRSKGRTRGLIPRAGSSKAASFARDRAKRYLEQSRRLLRATAPSEVPESRFRYVPAHRKIVGARGRTARGKSFPIGEGKFVNIPEGNMEVGGHRAFPAFGLLPHIKAGAQVRLATGVTRFGKGQQLVDIKGLKSDLNRLLAITGLPHIGARFVVWHVGRWALMEIVWKTPIETGAAAAGWSISPQLRGKRGYGRVGFRIKNPVPYVIFLEYGHSDQAPQGMMNVTFMQAQDELRHLMDLMIDWWKREQYLLRNLRFDMDLSAGVPYDPATLERKIPKMTWQRLLNLLKTRLPLNKPVAELNTNMYLAMRIDDPKDWHTVSEFREPTHIFEATTVKTKVPVYEVQDVPMDIGGSMEIHELTRQVGTRTQTSVSHVSGGRKPKANREADPTAPPADWFDNPNDLSSQAAALERKWRGGK